MRDTQREAETQAEGALHGAPCVEPDVGLDPGTQGSCPEPKTGAQLLSHPGIPIDFILNSFTFTTKLSRKYQELPHTALPQIQPALPSTSCTSVCAIC